MKSFDYAELQSLVRTLSVSHGLVSGFLHQVIAVSPRSSGFSTIRSLEIDFESTRIKNEAVKLIGPQEDQPLRKMRKQIRGALGGSSLAGRIFEAIIHRVFSDGWCSELTPLPIRMVSDGVPPVFSTDPSISLQPPQAIKDRLKATATSTQSCTVYASFSMR